MPVRSDTAALHEWNAGRKAAYATVAARPHPPGLSMGGRSRWSPAVLAVAILCSVSLFLLMGGPRIPVCE